MRRADNLSLVILGVLVPLGLLPANAPRRLALLIIPLLPFLASSNSQFHSMKFHYGVVLLFALLAAAAVVSQDRAPPLLRRPGLTIALTLTLLVSAGPWLQLGGRVAAPCPISAGAGLLGPQEVVMATDEIDPHLSHRDELLLFPFAVAPAVPDFPLPAAVAKATPESSAAVDVIVVGPVRYPKEQTLRVVGRSPYLADFPEIHRFGDVTVYRRRPL